MRSLYLTSRCSGPKEYVGILTGDDDFKSRKQYNILLQVGTLNSNKVLGPRSAGETRHAFSKAPSYGVKFTTATRELAERQLTSCRWCRNCLGVI